MHKIEELILKQLSNRLTRSTATSCSKWSERYRYMGKPIPGKWTFNYHPWLLEMHDCEVEKVVGQKAAQMGYTEWAINTAFFSMDIKEQDVLYILPTTDDASDFSATRFDPALESSEYLRNFFADVNNVSLKRAGTTALYVRGSHSKSKLKSIPTPVVILDEMEEMPDYTFALVKERQSGQLETKSLFLSTPTIEDHGINTEFKLSTQNIYHFKCPKCSRLTSLDFPDCLVVTADDLTDTSVKDSYLKCKECNGKLDHETKREWLKPVAKGGTGRFVPSHSDRDVEGFHVSQLYSCVKAGNPKELAEGFLRGQIDESYAQEFYNSKLGLTFVTRDAKVDDEQFSRCVGAHTQRCVQDDQTIRTLGIDVGAVLHLVVKEFKLNGREGANLSINDKHDAKIILAETSSGASNDFQEAETIFKDLNCKACVCDAEPERRAALQFAQRMYGRVLLCDYIFSQTGREVSVNEEEYLLKVNRTSWLDLTLGRYKNGNILVPKDHRKDFRRQIKEPTRTFKTDKWGAKYAVYLNTNADHFAHADNYAEIALPFAIGRGTNKDIKGMY